MRTRWRLLLRSGTFGTGAAIVAFWMGCALWGRHLVPFDPFEDDILNTLAAPSRAHWFGTDQLG
ncbi:MAG TPA: hypothetical protein VGL87_16190, partial [Steroidobacteraceae bacterium]